MRATHFVRRRNENFACLIVLEMSQRRSYEYDVRRRKFSERGNLVKHYRIHTGEKPFQGTYCEKRFSDSSTCDRHVLASAYEGRNV